METHTLGEFHGTRLHDVTADGEGAATTQRGVEHRAVRPLEVDCRAKPRVRPGGLESISTSLYYVERRTRVYIRVELTIFSSFARLNPKSLGGLGRANLLGVLWTAPALKQNSEWAILISPRAPSAISCRAWPGARPAAVSPYCRLYRRQPHLMCAVDPFAVRRR